MRYKIFVSIWLFLSILAVFPRMISAQTVSLKSDRILQLPGLKKIIGKEYTGYVNAGHSESLFYWFVVTHKPNSPLILWTNGGPGYSSMYGFFNETGPYHVTSTLQLIPNHHAWSRFANYLVIDQPANVGLSLVKGNKLAAGEKEGVRQFYQALTSFLKNHPLYQHSPIFLAGESYAGTSIPLLAQKILEENKKKVKINLKGLILVSPWADPSLQQSMDSTYAFNHGLITEKQKYAIDNLYDQCKHLIATHHYQYADKKCDEIQNKIQHLSHLELANIAYLYSSDDHLIEQYLNKPAVFKALHANLAGQFQCWAGKVNKMYQGHIQRSVKGTYNSLLQQHIPIMIFSGLNDGKDTNFLGIKKFIDALNWPEKKKYMTQKTLPIVSRTRFGKVLIGYQQSGGGLTWVTVLNAGHMVPLDQPRIDQIVKLFVHLHYKLK